MLHADVYTVWIFLASLAYLTILLVKRGERLPPTAPHITPPVALDDQLTARIVKLERLIADGQKQLHRAEELIAELDRAA